jgi:FhuF 2Fe-2S C-terminal domain
VKPGVVSPVAEIYEALRVVDASWNVEIGTPTGTGWIGGSDLRNAASGPLNELLRRIGERVKTGNPRTIAALFALRFGWSSAMAIAPFLRYQCVPDVALANVSFKFTASTFFERTAMHEPRGIVVGGDSRAAHPSMSTVADWPALMVALRHALVSQATPVVEALYDWAGFSKRGTWGMLTSSWASHFTGLCENPNDQRSMLAVIDTLFAGGDVVSVMQPRLHVVTVDNAFHLYQRRASCCRYYLVPEGTLCASCPLVSHEERLERNREWMKTQLTREAQRKGHD